MKVMVSSSDSQRFARAMSTATVGGIAVIIAVLLGFAPVPLAAAQASTSTVPAASATSQTTAPLTAGTERTDPPGIKQVWVHAGCFLMGSSDQQIQDAY